MKSYFDCWVQVAGSLFSQALAGEPQFVDALPRPMAGEPFGFSATIAGEVEGEFCVLLDGAILDSPLMGEGLKQREAWGELLREIAEAATGEMLAATGKKCRVEKFLPGGESVPVSRAFAIKTADHAWTLLVRDRVHAASAATDRILEESRPDRSVPLENRSHANSPGLELLLDIELEASLRFGSREMPLGEILDLAPGDVVQLDREVSEPVDLIVADKIVARGEVVLVNGNFGLKVTEVAAPTKRLESIRCLF